jgi:ornithine cyclodeaminase/alanine dehydrogenase-like protein (mu-crystallin family)
MKTTHFALVGTGNIANFHARAIELVEGAELVAVHSRREDSGREFATKYGAEYVADYATLLARPDIDAVCITTPSGTHAELGIAAARAKNLSTSHQRALTNLSRRARKTRCNSARFFRLVLGRERWH